MKSKIVPVKNVARLSQASKALLNRPAGAPGMGLVHGETGYGKTTAIAWLSNQAPSVYLRALACWSPAVMLESLCDELRVPATGSNGKLVKRIVESLARDPKTIFLDEADYIVTSKRMVETMRDLHDLTNVPVILIGMKGIDQRLAHLQQLTGRLAQDVKFQPLDLDDAGLIARELCEVTIAPDLLEHVHANAQGSARLIVVGLNRIEEFAAPRGLKEVRLADWTADKRQLFTGDAPATKVASLRTVR